MPTEARPIDVLQNAHNDPVKEAQPGTKRERRAVASIKRIEEIIAAGQRRGLGVTKVVQLPDGTCQIHFGTTDTTVAQESNDWDT